MLNLETAFVSQQVYNVVCSVYDFKQFFFSPKFLLNEQTHHIHKETNLREKKYLPMLLHLKKPEKSQFPINWLNAVLGLWHLVTYTLPATHWTNLLQKLGCRWIPLVFQAQKVGDIPVSQKGSRYIAFTLQLMAIGSGCSVTYKTKIMFGYIKALVINKKGVGYLHKWNKWTQAGIPFNLVY